MSDFCRCYETPGVAYDDFDGICHWRWDCLYINDRERATCKALYMEEARAKGLLDAEGNFLPIPAPPSTAAPAAKEK